VWPQLLRSAFEEEALKGCQQGDALRPSCSVPSGERDLSSAQIAGATLDSIRFNRQFSTSAAG
jgi:hypothetical protein